MRCPFVGLSAMLADARNGGLALGQSQQWLRHSRLLSKCTNNKTNAFLSIQCFQKGGGGQWRQDQPSAANTEYSVWLGSMDTSQWVRSQALDHSLIEVSKLAAHETHTRLGAAAPPPSLRSSARAFWARGALPHLPLLSWDEHILVAVPALLGRAVDPTAGVDHIADKVPVRCVSRGHDRKVQRQLKKLLHSLEDHVSVS